MSFLQIFKNSVELKQKFSEDIVEYLRVKNTIDETIAEAKNTYKKNNNKEAKTTAAYYQMLKDLSEQFEGIGYPWSEDGSKITDYVTGLWERLFDKVTEETIDNFSSWKKQKTRKEENRFKYIPFEVLQGDPKEPALVYHIQVKSVQGNDNRGYRRLYLTYLFSSYFEKLDDSWKLICWHAKKNNESDKDGSSWLPEIGEHLLSKGLPKFIIGTNNIDLLVTKNTIYTRKVTPTDTRKESKNTADRIKSENAPSTMKIPNRNIIFFGPPGTGKSYQVNQLISQSEATIGKSTWPGFNLKVNKVMPDGTPDKSYKKEHVKFFQRVTFHPEYSYYDFVGSYKPAVGRKYEEKTIVFKQEQGQFFPIDPVEFEKNDDPLKLLKPDIKENKFKKAFNNWGASPVVYYHFEPGPFSLAFVEALQNPKEKVVMLIEEINRGNCAAIFGDVFQLLDRDKNGIGEYSISIGSEWGAWLKDALKDISEDTMERYFSCSNTQYKIRLPSNLYLLATMNTADQGLFPMDSAFKRRWFMKYIGMNHADTATWSFEVPVQLGNDQRKQERNTLEWNIFRNNINKKILECTKNPDKRLGPFFVKKPEFANDAMGAELFFSKVMYYLWAVLKPGQRGKIFTDVTQTTSLDELETQYFDGKAVFTDEVLK